MTLLTTIKALTRGHTNHFSTTFCQRKLPSLFKQTCHRPQIQIGFTYLVPDKGQLNGCVCQAMYLRATAIVTAMLPAYFSGTTNNGATAYVRDQPGISTLYNQYGYASTTAAQVLRPGTCCPTSSLPVVAAGTRHLTAESSTDVHQLHKVYYHTVVERRSLTGELSLSCARPAADG